MIDFNYFGSAERKGVFYMRLALSHMHLEKCSACSWEALRDGGSDEGDCLLLFYRRKHDQAVDAEVVERPSSRYVRFPVSDEYELWLGVVS